MNIFLELATIVFIATVVSVIMRFLRQPLIVGYILAGILAGPYFFNALHTKEFIEILSKMGITILLFIVGLNMSPKIIKEIGKVSLFTGIGQVILTSIVGFLIALALGVNLTVAMYIAVGLTFSSTIIVLKLLSDKGDLNKLYGRISIGLLMVQDIIAAIVLVFVPSFSNSSFTSVPLELTVIALKAIQIAILVYLVTVHILPRFVRYLASSQELLFFFSISWGLLMASLFYLYGFSAEIGALIAGMTLSVTPYAYEIGSRLRPLRDFFIVIFFIFIGSQMKMDNLQQIILPATILSLFVLVGKPIIMIFIMHIFGFKRKTSYLTGLSVSQISEFSLILATLGFSLHQLSQNDLSLITLVGILTITGSTYFMLYADTIYPYVEKILKKFEFIKAKEEQAHKDAIHDVLLFGYDRVGHDFVGLFKKLDKDYLVIDFNPNLIREMQQKEIPCWYGDAEDIEFLNELHLKEIRMCVSTIPDFKTSSLLLKKVRQENHSAIVILLSHDIEEALELYKHGANYVMLPHYLSAKHTVHMIDKFGFDRKEFDEEKEKHVAYIKEKEMK